MPKMPKMKKFVDINQLEWLTMPQAGELLQISAKTVQRRCEDGTLPGFRFGSKWRIRKSMLDKLGQQG